MVVTVRQTERTCFQGTSTEVGAAQRGLAVTLVHRRWDLEGQFSPTHDGCLVFLG